MTTSGIVNNDHSTSPFQSFMGGMMAVPVRVRVMIGRGGLGSGRGVGSSGKGDTGSGRGVDTTGKGGYYIEVAAISPDVP